MAAAREDSLRELLDDVAKQINYEHPKITQTLIPSTGGNFTSQLYYCTISAPGRKDVKLFAKVAVVSEAMRTQAPTNVYDIERHVYTKLVKTYAEIEEKHNVPQEHRLVVPKFYGCIEKYMKEVIVLQNLSEEGFITYDRVKSMNWEYASKAVGELAKLHALSLAYQKEYPEDFAEANALLKRDLFDSPAMMAAMQQMMEKAFKLVREENRTKMMNFMTKFRPEEFARFFQPLRKPVLIHSDFRISNLMHKENQDGTVQVVIVDYQTMHPGSVANDLLYFIFTGTDGAFRRQHYTQLLDHYYKEMAAALTRLGLVPEEVFPREDLDEELKEVNTVLMGFLQLIPFGLVIASMMLPMITMDAEQALQPGEGEDIATVLESMMKSNELGTTRLNEVIDDYVAWGYL